METKRFTSDLNEYESTYTDARTILKFLGVRITRDDSPFVSSAWRAFLWFEYINMFGATIVECICMVEIAKGGTFQHAVYIFRMMPCTGYVVMGMAKLHSIIFNRSVFENLYKELHDMWPEGQIREEDHQIIGSVTKRIKLVVKGYYWCNNILLVIFMLPHVVDYARKLLGHDVELQLPFFYWLPFDPYQPLYFEVTFVVQVWQAFISVWMILASDVLFCIYLSHINTQFNLLSARIRRMFHVPVDDQLIAEYPLGEDNLYNPIGLAGGISSKEHNALQEKEFVLIIKRHQDLIRLSRDVETIFSFSMLLNFINSTVVLCFCGFCAVIVEKWNDIVYKTFLVTSVSQVWLLCWYGQQLLDSSAGVSTALYNCGWYVAPKNIKKCILIALYRSQKPLQVTTYGFSVLGLSTYTSIIKTAWSYFTLLLNVYRK